MIEHIGDILAIPFFTWLCYYFYNKHRTREENLLFLFSIGGLVADLLFSIRFLKRSPRGYLFAILYASIIFLLFKYLYILNIQSVV